mmetsp:Transcript_16401/g.22604  ORF Transcript_16401/g.22604 Transcript_16401/m.22604 type:complete len:851 (-) Transcript_16401:485-3037(-)|eukprot:CAMPEP_0170063684 /NCGR_PEP_ID=MMETSP0019_2-20121128/4457_1 /TAXON_ID=98059 /ORGANISM="Dinobryon sp., Strain UTEXLB2267" /LENGTH=850 /DNA_ID=CAMNT_0010270171 /DNA_START=30 /DNA_END=2582 /DNA_ORIENTATION=-
MSSHRKRIKPIHDELQQIENTDSGKDEPVNTVRSRSNSFSQAPVSVSALKVGTKVTIVGTDNVQQRVPKLEGCIGEIKEAPVHPATWFKVQFPDGSVVTFRPSALRPLKCENPTSSTILTSQSTSSDLGKAPKSASYRTSKAVTTSTEPTESDDGTKPPSPSDAARQSEEVTPEVPPEASPILLSSTDPDHWIGQQVTILGGKMNGEVGRVLSSGNGWVQIETAGGEVAKRAYNLSLCSVLLDGSPASRSEGRTRVKPTAGSHSRHHHHASVGDDVSETAEVPTVIARAPLRRAPQERSHSAAAAVSKNGTTTTAAVTHTRSTRSRDEVVSAAAPEVDSSVMAAFEAVAASERKVPSRSQRERERRSNEALARKEAAAAVEGVEDEYKQSFKSGEVESEGPDAARTIISHKRSRANSDLGRSPPHTRLHSSDEQQAEQGVQEASLREQAIVHHALQGGKHNAKYHQLLEQSRNGKRKVDDSIIEARRIFVNKYVARQQQKMKLRPNLTSLKHGINSTMAGLHSLNGVHLGMSCESIGFELHSARLFDDYNFCELCCVEKWPGAKFCWNEACAASPVYFKLTGVSVEELEAMRVEQLELQRQAEVSYSDSMDGTNNSRDLDAEPPLSARTRKNSSWGSANNLSGSNSNTPGSPKAAVHRRGSASELKSPRRGSNLAIDTSSPGPVGSSRSPKSKLLRSSIDSNSNSFNNSSCSRDEVADTISSHVLSVRLPSEIDTEEQQQQLLQQQLLSTNSNSSFVLADAEVSHVAAYLLQMPSILLGGSGVYNNSKDDNESEEETVEIQKDYYRPVEVLDKVEVDEDEGQCSSNSSRDDGMAIQSNHNNELDEQQQDR